ncbi:hypothetical protein RJ640_014940 [Escallonia rubra]|uniref:F-box domain-containing protein n=1 Tax=Escallonia rubra TaxID=112253 RepID=A0AA88S3P6_9ASTE|nr:hypothetical protein RJ640_014940 [Escallonia rubra]
MEGAMDRISQLPELIIHHILSFLSGKEAAQTSVLSKTWLSSWSTNPVLDLDETYFGEDPLSWYQENPETEGKRQKFMKFLRDTMIRYREHNPRIKRLVLRVNIVNCDMVSLADEWIGLALENHVEELDLFIQMRPWREYALPRVVFTTSLLTELRLRECKLEHIGINGAIKCHALRILRLVSVITDKWAIQNLISSCPLIQELCIKCCEGWENIQIGNLHKLKKLEISTFIDQIFDVSAPSLESFIYWPCKSAVWMPELSNIRTSHNLKELVLGHVTCITDSFLEDLILEFPFLEVLSLSCCDGLKKIRVSSRTLKHITVSSCAGLRKAKFGTPNLLSLSYSENPIRSLSFTYDQGQWVADISILCDKMVRGTWFPNLGALLTKLNQFKLWPSIMSESNRFVVPDLGAIPPPRHQVRNLELDISTSRYEFVDAMLWCCFPRTLTFNWRFFSDRVFVKFLYGELMDGGNRGCCVSRPVKCWRHYLKGVGVEGFRESEGVWGPLCLTSSSEAYDHPYVYTTVQLRLECILQLQQLSSDVSAALPERGRILKEIHKISQGDDSWTLEEEDEFSFRLTWQIKEDIPIRGAINVVLECFKTLHGYCLHWHGSVVVVLLSLLGDLVARVGQRDRRSVALYSRDSVVLQFDTEGAMDRISQLPEPIMHHILSFLSGKEAAQTSAVSKTWLSAWSTNPVLDLDQTYFEENPNIERRQKFMKFLRDTMIRYREQKPMIKRLFLRVNFVDSNLVSLADEWIGLALENHVEELDLFIRTWPYRALPQAIFKASRLTELRLRECKLEHIGGSGAIKCHALRILHLLNVNADIWAIQSLISSCPLIQELCIKYCQGWENIQIGNLHDLKILEVSTYDDQIFDVSAPSLESFKYQSGKTALCAPELSSIRTSHNLKELVLNYVTITDSFFEDLILEFPFLEVLSLLLCKGLKRIHVSSRTLKHVTVSSFEWLTEVALAEAKFDTPNLLSISYSDNHIRSLSFTYDQGQWVADISIICDERVMGTCFPNLGDFLTKLNRFELWPSIMSKSNRFVAPDLEAIPPPRHQVRNLDLRVYTSRHEFVDAMLWCCFPRTLTFNLKYCSPREFVKFLYDELMERGKRGCCVSRPVKCWRHYLKGVSMESFKETEGVWRPLHLELSSDAYNNLHAYTSVRLRLVW